MPYKTLPWLGHAVRRFPDFSQSTYVVHYNVHAIRAFQRLRSLLRQKAWAIHMLEKGVMHDLHDFVTGHFGIGVYFGNGDAFFPQFLGVYEAFSYKLVPDVVAGVSAEYVELRKVYGNPLGKFYRIPNLFPSFIWGANYEGPCDNVYSRFLGGFHGGF
jgi:hypothetical protein